MLLPMLRLALENNALTGDSETATACPHINESGNQAQCEAASSRKTRRCFCCGLEMTDSGQCETRAASECDHGALAKVQVERMEAALEQLLVCERCCVADVIVGARISQNKCCKTAVELCVRWLAIGVRSSRLSSNTAYSYAYSRHGTEQPPGLDQQ